jgi:hypothetical protein
MGDGVVSCCEKSAEKRPSELNIQRVSNGYIVGGYGSERRVALTIAELWELFGR